MSTMWVAPPRGRAVHRLPHLTQQPCVPLGWEVPLSYKDQSDSSGKIEKQKLN